MNTTTHIQPERSRLSIRQRINPIRSLTPESLTRILDAFHSGELRHAALVWDAIERRDDILKCVATKRKQAVARLRWDILTIDDSQEAHQHREALLHFYNHLTATHACDENRTGGVPLLLRQMMDATGKGYAVHEIIWRTTHDKQLTADFRFAPLWFFENKTGRLQYLAEEHSQSGIPLEPGAWLTTTGDALMEPCSIAYLFKHLPLRDWLVYCERNGMPGVKGVTEAAPGSPEWDAARDAVRDFGAEFHALMSRGTLIEPIDLTSRGELPYPALVERMDRAIAALWRGADLSTLSAAHTGASVQSSEADMLEQDDAQHLSETLNTQVDRHLIQYRFGSTQPKAYFQLLPVNENERLKELEIAERLAALGYEPDTQQLAERLGLSHLTPKS